MQEVAIWLLMYIGIMCMPLAMRSVPSISGSYYYFTGNP